MRMNTSKLKLNIQRTTTIFLAVVLLLLPVSAIDAEDYFDHAVGDLYVYDLTDAVGLWTVTADEQEQFEGRVFDFTFPTDMEIELDIQTTLAPIDFSYIDDKKIVNVYEAVQVTYMPTDMYEPDAFCYFSVWLEPKITIYDKAGNVLSVQRGDSKALNLYSGDTDFEQTYPLDLSLSVEWPAGAVSCLINLVGGATSTFDDGAAYGWMRIAKGAETLGAEMEDKTNSELADDLNHDVGNVGDDLAAAGDAFGSVPEPDISDVMKPVDQLVDAGAMMQFTKFAGIISGSAIVASYLTILGIVMMFAYVLFGKRDA